MTQTIKIVAVFSLVLFTTELFAQKKMIAKIDSFLHDRYYRVNIDTDYLERPARRWSVSLGGNMSTTGLEVTSSINGKDCHTKMDADKTLTTSLSVAYSGLSLSLSLNPAKLSGKETDWELNLTSYGNRMGVDITATDSKTMSGTMRFSDRMVDLATGDIRQKLFYLNGYYAFNYRRFSYPAAFQQSYIQKQSAGSWLLNASVYGSRTTTENLLTVNSQLDYLKVAFGGGYGYNWVPQKNWLFHISGAPTLCLFSHSRLEIDGEREQLRWHFPEFIISGKGAVVYRYKKWFVGANMVFNFSVNGEDNSLQAMNTRWFAKSFIGFKF